MSEITKALNSLQEVIGNMQKNTAISAEALLSQKTLAARLRNLEAPNKSAQGKQRRDLLARETPQPRTAAKAYQQLVARYGFPRRCPVMRKVTVTEPSLKQTQNSYQNVADWLEEWKATLINDLNTHGYNGPVVATMIAIQRRGGRTADKLRIKIPYGVAEVDWLKVAPPSLLTVSRSFATDADRQWHCGVFAWAIGQTEAVQKLLDAGYSARPSYSEARKFFNQTKR